ncbi:CRISPR system precrRNA processing endoribonuclease RAMP protein Cas6 [Nitrosomonas sp.]|uniref:CRISPR system precrRNA processing endoribonuclease RAMP protein Cas6 n=1 Tax=Nitrosomonas sp. TaxID=42353 RepID=UPI002089228B|nr:CRISPR system precrRNA processing endoribonuclease RAMP protein Cas6 [Nitrosomonas sp.]GJL77003.1 MAG: hypothetical protein NMNS02_31090 [Nitrosomonas sp.]
MILLELHVTLYSNQTGSAVSASPFLGGILHGTFERLVRMHAPIICRDLGIAADSQLKRYAILPPPYRWYQQLTQQAKTMKCGIILYDKSQRYAQTIEALLKQWHEIRFEGRTDRVHCDQITFHMPDIETAAQQKPNLQSINSQNHFTHIHSPCNHITLHFFTPLTTKNLQLPKLLPIVRSIAKRIQKLEPSLADSLNLGSLAWVEAEEQIRRLPIAQHQLEPVDWKYHSSNHANCIPCTGLLGQIHFTGHIPAAITTLLHWGQWIGAGQGPALGQGMYYINETLIRFDAFTSENPE